MKRFLSCIFTLLLLGGIGILVSGVIMNVFKAGTDSGFYHFFNDNVWGWIIMFGSIVVGAIGRKIMGPIFDFDIWDSIFDFFDLFSGNGDDYSNSGYGDSSYDSKASNSSDYSYGVDSRRYYNDGRCIGYSVGNRYYDDNGSCVGYDVGNRHYDSDGNSTGYRVGDREYDRDGNCTGYWVGDTFYDSDGNKIY